jgi:hypothetical protein
MANARKKFHLDFLQTFSSPTREHPYRWRRLKHAASGFRLDLCRLLGK